MIAATFIITVEEGHTAVRTQGGDGALPAKTLDAAIEALQHERANVHKCPYQRARDRDRSGEAGQTAKQAGPKARARAAESGIAQPSGALNTDGDGNG